MSGENIPIFSCNSEFHSYNFFWQYRDFFSSFGTHFVSFSWVATIEKEEKKLDSFCSRILSTRKNNSILSCICPAGWWVLFIDTAFFLELGYGKSTTRWDPECLLCAWNESWMKSRHLNPRKWSRNPMQQVVSKPADTNTQKSPF